jgi:hypothetical protein
VALWVTKLHALAVLVDAGPRDLNGLWLWGAWTSDIRAAAAHLVSNSRQDRSSRYYAAAPLVSK